MTEPTIDGSIHKVEVHDRALSLEEVKAIHDVKMGQLPEECPDCNSESGFWEYKAVMSEYGLSVKKMKCQECGFDIAELAPDFVLEQVPTEKLEGGDD